MHPFLFVAPLLIATATFTAIKHDKDLRRANQATSTAYAMLAYHNAASEHKVATGATGTFPTLARATAQAAATTFMTCADAKTVLTIYNRTTLYPTTSAVVQALGSVSHHAPDVGVTTSGGFLAADGRLVAVPCTVAANRPALLTQVIP